MIATLEELYVAISRLEVALRRSGDTQVALSLEKAMSGMTAGEILSDLGVILQSHKLSSHQLVANEALQFIEGMLGPRRQ